MVERMSSDWIASGVPVNSLSKSNQNLQTIKTISSDNVIVQQRSLQSYFKKTMSFYLFLSFCFDAPGSNLSVQQFLISCLCKPTDCEIHVILCGKIM